METFKLSKQQCINSINQSHFSDKKKGSTVNFGLPVLTRFYPNLRWLDDVFSWLAWDIDTTGSPILAMLPWITIVPKVWQNVWFYSMISVTIPVPTVLPPSLSVKRSPVSKGTSSISEIVKGVLSPGMTISTPSGSWIVAATSPVRTNIWGV